MISLKSHELQKNARSKKWKTLSDEDIQKLHVHLLEMLVDVDKVCRRNELFYSLSGGTALGAVRHGGFIPWDDDADVFFTRDSFNKLLQCFDEELGEKYAIHCPERTPQLGSTAIQIVKKNTVFRTIATAMSEDPGVFLDIFILENAPNNRMIRFLHGLLCMVLGFCLSCSRYYCFRKEMEEIFCESSKDIMRNITIKSCIGKMLAFMRIEKWLMLTYKAYSMCKDKKSQYVVCPSGIHYYFGEIFKRSHYCKTKDIMFEGHKLRIIDEYDTALRRLYGNYMEIPPVEKREKHIAIELDI